jgi:hypothetical protein
MAEHDSRRESRARALQKPAVSFTVFRRAEPDVREAILGRLGREADEGGPEVPTRQD